MMKQPTVRPARAAIAAVLAFAPTALMAQVAAPSAPPPVTVTQAAPAPVIAAPAPAAPATAAPVMLPQSPVVQPIPAPAPVVAETVTEEAPVQRSAPARSAPVRTATVAPRVVEEPAASDAPVKNDITPVAPVQSSPIVADSAASESAAAPVEPMTTDGSNGLEWGLVGGAVVLLGGVGLMAMRRRRPEREDAVAYAPVEWTAPMEPVMQPIFSPATEMPAMAKAHTGHGSLEAIVAAAPTAENPFRTRKNRLRRAHFLLRQQSKPTMYDTPIAAATANIQPQHRPSPVYDFGGNMGQRRGFRPATT